MMLYYRPLSSTVSAGVQWVGMGTSSCCWCHQQDTQRSLLQDGTRLGLLLVVAKFLPKAACLNSPAMR